MIAQLALAITLSGIDNDGYSSLDRSYEAQAASRAPCGPNSVYVLLRLHGRDVNYSDIEAILPKSPAGTTLADMSDACTSLGLPVTVRKLDVEDIPTIRNRFPLIVHRVPFGNTHIGHFYLLCDVRNGTATYVDGTTGIVHIEPWRYLAQQLSGYLIVPDASHSWHPFDRFLAATAIVLTSTLIFLRPRGNCGLLIVAIFALSTSLAGVARADTVDNDLSVRKAGADTANCLYLLAFAYGVPQSYSDILRLIGTGGSKSANLTQAKAIAMELGMHCDLVRFTPQELVSINTPIMTAVEAPGNRNANFIIVYFADTHHVDFVEGNCGTFHRATYDAFLRDWIGYAIVVRPRTGHTTIAVSATAGVLLATSFVYLTRIMFDAL